MISPQMHQSRESEFVVTQQQVSSLPSPPKQVSHPLPKQPRHFSRKGILSLLVLVAMLLLLFAGQLFWNLSQVVMHKTSAVPRPTPTVNQNKDIGPLLPPGKATAPQLALSTGKYVLYEQQKNIALVSVTGRTPIVLSTPGYIFNLAVSPLLTPSGLLLYSGNGLWLTDIFNGTSKQIATLPTGQVITSMALSSDGSTIAWSTEPANGSGNVTLYAGPLEKSVPVYQHDATDCPCYRVFSFLSGQGTTANSTVLLTDDRGDHRAVHYGLWSLNLADTPLEDPQPLLAGDAQQGPLVLSPTGNTLLYSTNQGIVPTTDDLSVPTDIAALNYANSLFIASIGVSSDGNDHDPVLNSTHSSILSEQHDLTNSAEYHWVTTPLFSPDGHTLVYVVFSSDAQTPFDRHNAVYVVHITGSGAQLKVGKPQLLATSTDRFIELGTWLNDSILTFYSDGTLYAMDITNGAVTTIMQTTAYTRVVAVVQGVIV
ncbi:MAG: hypothetical protein NVS4B12_09420 [Ktedonobacteraceae bacterium]